jgi:hypothetical protein
MVDTTYKQPTVNDTAIQNHVFKILDQIMTKNGANQRNPSFQPTPQTEPIIQPNPITLA